MLYEIRNYHYNPEKFAAYRQWAENDAVPFLKANLDVVGFWIDAGIPPEIHGQKPMDLPLGSANVTWVIRWKDKDDRDAGHERVFKGDAWQEVWSRHPDAGGYFQMEAKFTEAI